MSREIDRLDEFFDWLITPRVSPQSDSQWKRQYLKKFSRVIERVRDLRVMRPCKELDDAIASLRTAQEKLRHGFVYVAPKSDPKGRGSESLRFLTTERSRDEAKRRPLAVLVAHYIYPERSAYERIRSDLEKRGIHCRTETLRQEYHRFLIGLKGERAPAILEVASKHYVQFRLEKLLTARHPRKRLIVTASEHDLLSGIAEGWRLKPKKRLRLLTRLRLLN